MQIRSRNLIFLYLTIKELNDIKKEQFGITSQKASKKSIIDIMQEHCAREIIIIKNYQFETFFNV